MKLHRFLVICTVAVIIILVIVVWFFPSNDDFRTENPFWNGTRDISSSYSVSPLKSMDDLSTSYQGAALILIPYLDFTAVELEELESFVIQGGILILADDYGHGNQILKYLGLKARFAGQALLDPLSNYKNKWFPRISLTISSFVPNDVESLVFNHATALTGVEIGDTLAQSSSFSFLDLDNNQEWNGDEPTGPMPVISRHTLGSGQVILISDPSIFINSAVKKENNSTFIQNIIGDTTTMLFIDQGHLPPSNLHQTKDLLAVIRSSLATPAGILGVVILILTITLMPIWHERRRY